MHLPSFLRKRRSLPSWCDPVFLIAVIAAYTIVASLFIGSESSYFDEGFTSYLARFTPLEIAHYTALDVHPPLYYIVLHYWQQVVGIDVFWLRFLSVIWGSVAIVFAFLLIRRLFSRGVAYATVPFLILCPLFIRYSEAMRMYTMAMAIVCAATLILTKLVLEKPRRPKLLWGLYAVLVSLGMWTNYFTAFIWIAHLLWLLSERYSQKSTSGLLKKWWISIGTAVVLYLPWLPWLLARFADVQTTGFWIKPISLDTLISTLTTATIYKSADVVTNWLTIGVVVFVSLSGYIIARVYRSAKGQQKRALRLLIFCSAAPIVLLILLSLPPFRSSYAYRYILGGVFFSFLLLGVSLYLVRFKHHEALKKAGLYTFAIIILLTGTIHTKQAGNRSLDTGVKNMVAQAIERIQSSASSNPTPIISRSPYTYYTSALYETARSPVYYTYSDSLNKVGSTHMLYDHPDKRGIKDLPTFVHTYESVWLIAEDPYGATTPPAPQWQKIREFVLRDPATGQPTVYAAEFAAP